MMRVSKVVRKEGTQASRERREHAINGVKRHISRNYEDVHLVDHWPMARVASIVSGLLKTQRRFVLFVHFEDWDIDTTKNRIAFAIRSGVSWRAVRRCFLVSSAA